MGTLKDLAPYGPILIFFGMAFFISSLILGISYLRSPKRPSAAKLDPYECGFDPFSEPRQQFDVRFYLIALLFVIFDLEIVYLFPWAITLKSIGVVGFWSMMLFLGILLIGFIYEWRKGALEWE